MSDPVSNSEIEDVLASIRRLVSENAKALKGDKDRDPEAEKLVLTPAFRVDEGEAPAQELDVFSVDTDTWNDTAGRAEPTENQGIFSHAKQPPLTAGGAREEPAEQDQGNREVASDEVAYVTEPGAADDVAHAAAEAVEPASDVEPPSDEASATGPEDAGESPAETALEQRIAELESAVELRAPEAVSGSAPDSAETAGAGEADEIAPGGDHMETVSSGAEEASGDAEPGAADDAPPRSWIEGLVAAAATAEAARIADRTPTLVEPVDDGATVTESAEALAEGAAPEDVVPEDVVPEVAAAETGGGSEPVAEVVAEEPPEVEADDGRVAGANEVPETLDLTPEHAVAAVSEPADDAPAAKVVEPIDEALETAKAESADLEVPEPADEASGAAEDVAVTEAAAEPNRSWVDRLIAAAATLRGGSEGEAAKAEENADADTVPDDPGFVSVAADEAREDEAGEDEAGEDKAGEGDVAATDAETDDAPLTLDERVEPEADVRADEIEIEATLEWEAVDLEDAESDADAIVDVETVLTGPWTAPQAMSADAGAEPQAETMPAATAEDAPVGALEWEPVGTSDDTEPATADGEQFASETLAEMAATTAAEEVGGAVSDDPMPEEALDAAEAETHDADAFGDVKNESQVFDFQEDQDPDLEQVKDDEEAANDGGDEAGSAFSADALDEDSAAIAAAEEADWEDAGMAVAGVGVAEFATARAPEDDETAAEPSTEVAARRDDETVIDEAMLRELVTQLVRDELQGAVGERITHNVRRLIRREIARALTLQDFEK